MIPQLPPPSEQDAATAAFAAPAVIAWFVCANSRSATSQDNCLMVTNVSLLPVPSAAHETEFILSAPILRSDAAELFSKVAADLESEMML
jgi:hypothetical protein